MIPEKLKKLIELLITKTQEKKAIWNKGSANNQFKLSLSGGIAMTVSKWDGDYNNQDSYSVTIFNQNGDAIERFETENNSDLNDINFLKTFHKVASDQYYKVEETMDLLFESIVSQEIIGQKEEQSPSFAAEEEDDLPF